MRGERKGSRGEVKGERAKSKEDGGGRKGHVREVSWEGRREEKDRMGEKVRGEEELRGKVREEGKGEDGEKRG